jgi:hypothetical protein
LKVLVVLWLTFSKWHSIKKTKFSAIAPCSITVARWQRMNRSYGSVQRRG